MDDRYGVAWPGAKLRRPAVDPVIPAADRARLLASHALLAPACAAPPPHIRDWLPMEPDRRGVAIEGAVMGMTAAGLVAVGGAIPYAIGVLIFQGPVAWQAALGRYALLLAEIVAVITAVVFGSRIVRFGQVTGKVPENVAARTYHGRYLMSADFDGPARVMLRRVQDAIDSVLASEVCRAGLLDTAATRQSLAEQEWDIAVALREQGRLRAARSSLDPRAKGTGPVTAEVLAWQAEAATLADASIAGRVAALEAYAKEVRAADAAYRDWRHAESLGQLRDRHLEMLARTAADEHGIAEIEAMSDQARAIRQALRRA
jgi:hypothetical protein